MYRIVAKHINSYFGTCWQLQKKGWFGWYNIDWYLSKERAIHEMNKLMEPPIYPRTKTSVL